ncbi:hypothetical protein [Duganella caerulea]|uniref:hypothetical protein n=1 Tax=Duganella caerulea TaxID=2885762 RepID=UPI00403761C3
MSEWSLSLVLNAAEVRVLKSALLVEIACLEGRVRIDADPSIWYPALSAARRVMTVLSDKANKHLLDL